MERVGMKRVGMARIGMERIGMERRWSGGGGAATVRHGGVGDFRKVMREGRHCYEAQQDTRGRR